MHVVAVVDNDVVVAVVLVDENKNFELTVWVVQLHQQVYLPNAKFRALFGDIGFVTGVVDSPIRNAGRKFTFPDI